MKAPAAFLDLALRSQPRLLAVLHYSDAPIEPSAVATLLFQETQSITGILHRIEARGWVQRTSDPNDRRAVGITLTASGHSSLRRSSRSRRSSTRSCSRQNRRPQTERQVELRLKKVRAIGFKLPETDFKLRRAQQYPIWKD